MTQQVPNTLARYVQVLDHKVQQAQAHRAHTQAQLARTHAKLTMLQEMAQTAQLKKSVGNVALYVNAAGFRSSLTDMAQQFRDVCGVQQLELVQAQQQVQHAILRHESISGVLAQAHIQATRHEARQAQKAMDEMASQSWMRQRHTETGNC